MFQYPLRLKYRLRGNLRRGAPYVGRTSTRGRDSKGHPLRSWYAQMLRNLNQAGRARTGAK